MTLKHYDPALHEIIEINGKVRGFKRKDATPQVVELPPEKSTFHTQNETITTNSQALGGMNNTFYAPVNAEIQLQADIVDALGNRQTQIDQVEFGYPPVLKMPVVKMAGGINGSVVDEVYFTVTLNNGVLTATGSLPASGDWKLLTSRINNSLASIGADWKVERENTTFLA